ncbi:hypothetical protein NEMBOFW57_001934 [Staphylotrichum longicolle]|uniref:BPL/LPL catalytic domain-containing protein n=1 Tax=Staphylotrichum longicolle TaxID=669026 RepID=A0AAD4F322_9PEZI|nr:hypothetical protein NEMBOFW57_001934 [Staphylotrichum longicolle]
MASLRRPLRHLHLPSIHPHYIPYSLASRVQEHFRREHLDFKDISSSPTAPSHQPLPPPPPPTLISFTPAPIYTLGRRQTAPLTPTELARLTAPLRIRAPLRAGGSGSGASGSRREDGDPTRAPVTVPPSVLHSPRGGLTTYHGPGQVVLWPVLDLKSALHRQFTVKCYARLLEDTTIATLAAVFGLEAFTTGDPGPASAPSEEDVVVVDGAEEEEEMAKIAALGVHLRRHVTSLGTALNLTTPPPTVTDETVSPWARIVACGLEGRGVTSVAGEVGLKRADALLRKFQAPRATLGLFLEADVAGMREELVAGYWAEELSGRIGAQGVEEVGGEEAVELMERLVRDDGTAEEKGYLERVREEVWLT